MIEMRLLGGIRPAQSVAERVRQRCAVDLGRERAEAALVRHALAVSAIVRFVRPW